MRCKITLVLIVATISFLNAQDSSDVSASLNDVYKQADGNKSFEVNFDPGNIFGSNSGDQFNLFDGGIKFRAFTSEKSAFRAGLDISFLNATDILQQEDITNGDEELKGTLSSLSIMLKPGYEKHFGDLARLSPYIGIQGLIGYSSSAATEERQNATTVYLVTWRNDPVISGYGSIDVGVGVFAGVDYYFVKKLYLGIEIGYGVQYSNLLKTKYTNQNNSQSDYEEKNGSVIGIAPSLATGNLRLGWTF